MVLAANLLTGWACAQNAQLQVLYSFTGPDGANPFGSLVQGADGSFYGTTESGGVGGGTVFNITTNGVLTTLAFFDNYNGQYPYSGLTPGNDGTFYGTTAGGGAWGSGTVFNVTTNGVLTTLYSFSQARGNNLTNADGMAPFAGLTLGTNGNFYGTTYEGGTKGYGTVFEVTTNGALTPLVTFEIYTNGANPNGALTLGNDGNFYGTTEGGGGSVSNGYVAAGTVFKMTADGLLLWDSSFYRGSNGLKPEASLTMAADGNLYGTAPGGGSQDNGTVFKVTTNGALSTLYSCGPGSSNAGGSGSYAGLVAGPDKNLYGCMTSGGEFGNGTVFRITTNGVFTTLWTFDGTNGGVPFAGLIFGTDGNFYGTCTSGGSGNSGTVFKLVVPPSLGLPTFSNGVTQIAVSGLARPNVQIQSATNLAGPWTLLTNLPFNGGSGLVTDNAPVTSARFYRAVVQ